MKTLSNLFAAAMIISMLAACGGSVAMYVCMKLIRHKTKHLSFMLGLPAIIIAQCGAVWAAHALLFR